MRVAREASNAATEATVLALDGVKKRRVIIVRGRIVNVVA